MMLTAGKPYSVEELQRMRDETKAAAPDLALKDATRIYYNGPISGEHAAKVAGNLRKLRVLNSVDVPVELVDAAHIPLGAIVYFAGDKLFAFGIDPADAE